MKLRDSNSLRTGLKDRGRRRREKIAEIAGAPQRQARNDLCPQLELVRRDAKDLILLPRNVRAVDEAQIQRVVHSIEIAGFVDPVIIDETNTVIDGAIRVIAASKMGLSPIPCIVTSHLNATEKRALRLALNRLGEKGTWSLPELKAELIELVDAGIEIEASGFTITEFDQITFDDGIDPVEKGVLTPSPGSVAVAQYGDVFVFDDGHRIIGGDSTVTDVYRPLMQDQQARLVLTDEPYNVPVVGHVTKGQHREFEMASGEMSDAQFQNFNAQWICATIEYLCDGGLIGTFIDWRGYPKVDAAALALGLTPINLIVWTKTNGGMGSLYRSQHELFPIYKKGDAAHVNNIQLGKTGRWRSNVWSYPGASSVSSDSRKGLQFHPTVKPTTMCADAIIDLTNRGDVVLDPFLGSGTTLIAAQNVGRRCYGIELDPRYIDVAIRRYREAYGKSAILESTGEAFEEVEGRRKFETTRA